MTTKNTYHMRAVLTGPGAPKVLEGDVVVTDVQIPIEPIDPIPSGDIGLTYVRTIGLPPLCMGYAYGDCTGRIVNDKVRLIFSGDEAVYRSPIYEVEITDANVATFVQSWDEPYDGKRGTWMQGAALLATAAELEVEAARRNLPWLLNAAAWYRKLGKTTQSTEWVWVDFATAGTPALNGGHYYAADLDLLYVTYADSYNVAGRPDWNCLAIRLHPDGSSETWGPWRLVALDGEGTLRFGPRAAMNLRPHPTSGLMLACTALSSGNAGCPWGTNLVGGAPWPTAYTPVGPTTRDVELADCYLYGYYMGPVINPVTGETSEPIRSTRRPLHPYIHESFANNNQLNYVDPAKYNGVGSWTDSDTLTGFLPLDDRCYFFAGVNGSPIQNPVDPLAAHGWYANASNNFTCTHGHAAVPYGITGPVCTARFPAALVYHMADLEKVKAGNAIDWQQEPFAWSNLEVEFGIQTAPIDSVGNAKTISGGFFDPRTRDLYLIAHGADRGQVTWGLINSAIHQFKVT
jgi:hypothetical protein